MRFLSDILIEAGLIVNGSVQVDTIAGAVTDTDKFLVSDGGVLKYRTGAQVAADIDAMTKSVYDTDGDGVVDNAEKITVVARNSTGSTIYKGTIVYLSGSTGNRPNMLKAQANTEPTSSKTFGVVVADVANNSDGEVAALGTLHDLDTRNSAPNPFTSDVLLDGDVIWLSPTTAGYVTKTKPSAPNHAVFIGIVARTSPTNGRIVYRIQNGFELEELHNVSALTPSNNDGIFYNSSTGLWEAKSIATAAGGTIGTVTSVAMTVPTGLQIGGSPITTSGTLALTYASGYAIPTTVKQSNWDDAYTWVANFPTQSGNSGKYLTTDGNTLSWATVTAGISGSGTTNYLSKWTSSSALGNSLVFDNGTSVGIGTTSISTATNQRVVEVLAQEYPTLRLKTVAGSVNAEITANGGNGTFNIGTTTTHPLFFYTNNAERMRIFASTGNVAIGYGGSPTDAGFRLDVSGTFRSTLDANINGLTVGKGGGSVASNTVVGSNAGVAITTATLNTLIGFDAGRNITNEGGNTFVGWYSGRSLNTGYYNTAVGVWSLTSATSGHSNVAIGMQAGEAINSGRQNVFVGMYAGDNMTTSIGSTIVGYQTGRGVTTGNYNTIIGANVTGLSSSLSNTIILADGQGNQRIRIDNTGNVGVNTTSISQLGSNITTLDIVGRSDAFTGGIYLRSSANAVRGYIYGTNNLFSIGSETSVPLTFQTAATERARIFANGNFAIGTTTDAGYKLDVNGTTRFNGASLIEGGANVGLVITNSGTLAGLRIQNTTYAYIHLNRAGTAGRSFGVFNASGDIAIQETAVWSGVNWHIFYGNGDYSAVGSGLFGSNGTANASAILQANSTTKGFLPPRMTSTQRAAITTPAVGLVVYQTDGSEGLYENTSTGWRIVNAAGAGSGVTGTGTTNYLSKWTSSTALGDSMIYDNGTSVGIGTATPNATYKLEVIGSARITGVSYPSLVIGTTEFQAFSGSGNYMSILNGSGASAYGVVFGSNRNALEFYAGSATERMRIASTGNILIGTTTDGGYKLDVNGTAIINNVIFSSNASMRVIEYNNASGLTLQNTAGPLYMNATMTINRAGDVQIYNNFAALRYISFSGSYKINTNDGYSNQFGLNIGADGTRVMQIFNGGNVAFEKGVDYTSTNSASALVAMNSTTQGFLPPRMTETQKNAISTPATGLIIYQTDGVSGLYVYTGSAWKALAIVS